MLEADEITARMDEARQNIGVELRGFAQNTLEYVEKEAELTFEPLELPDLKVKIRAGTRWSSCAATTTSTTSRRCVPTSASTRRC